MTGTLSELLARPRGLQTSQGPAASPHSPSVRLWLCPAAGGLLSMELRQRLNLPALPRGSSSTQAHPWQGMPGITVFPALEGPPPWAGPRPLPGGAHGARSPVTRTTTDLRCARERGTPGQVVSAHSRPGGPEASALRNYPSHAGERAAFGSFDTYPASGQSPREENVLSFRRMKVSSNL